MQTLTKGEQRRWWCAALGSAVLGVVAMGLFRGPRQPSDAGKNTPSRREVTLISPQDTAGNDEAVLLDPTPLFLPTKWNATQRSIAPREAGGKFQGFDAPKWNFRENELKIGLPSPITVPESIAEAVAAEGPVVPLVGLGRSVALIVEGGARRGFVNVVATRSGRSILKNQLSEGPPVSGAWQPLEFVAGVDAVGLMGPLVLTARSGSDEVDGFFASYLLRTLRLGERLPPGFYRITIGP